MCTLVAITYHTVHLVTITVNINIAQVSVINAYDYHIESDIDVVQSALPYVHVQFTFNFKIYTLAYYYMYTI